MKDGALDSVTKELIYVAVSITNSCSYCTRSHTFAAKKKGASDEMIKEMIDVQKPVIFDCLVDKSENCFPMIPSGKPHNQMILGPEEEEEISEEGKVLV